VSLTKISINNFRCFKNVDLQLSPGINFFYGKNGSGKTSILESVFIFSSGKSFKSSNLASLVNYENDKFTLKAFDNLKGYIVEIEKNKNKLIKEITRRAKYILIHFNASSLMIHLGMSGKLRIQSIGNNFFKKHDHIELIFDKEKIVFNDTRRFGSIHFTKSFKNHRLIENLGVEPLSREFNKDYLFEICKIKNISIKKLIMDQKVVVGVGNIYASESLFLAKIKPNRLSKTISLKECNQLTNAIKRVLRYAIRMGGTTLKDFYSADGSEGYFNLNLNVYDREDENCKNCKSKIKKITIGQRASFFCDSCQN